MRRLSVFNNISLDGYFVDAKGGIRWAREQDAESLQFTVGNVRGSGVMLFGPMIGDCGFYVMSS